MAISGLKIENHAVPSLSWNYLHGSSAGMNTPLGVDPLLENKPSASVPGFIEDGLERFGVISGFLS